MKLRELSLTSFRCFEQLRLEFAEDLTVFVGNNGAGKTTVLDGIAYALSRILTRLPKSKGSKNLRTEDIRIDKRGNPPKTARNHSISDVVRRVKSLPENADTETP